MEDRSLLAVTITVVFNIDATTIWKLCHHNGKARFLIGAFR